MNKKSHRPDTITGTDGKSRCWWAGSDPEYQRYHDEEWGRPVFDDQKLFEKLCLESFQAGLSWLTILKKRNHFRQAFKDFNPHKLANFSQSEIEGLMKNPYIVRNRAKIEAVIDNAACLPAISKAYGSFGAYVWSFLPDIKERPSKKNRETLSALTATKTSIELAKDLKKYGFKFIGPTMTYAFMQSIGMINDHVLGCHCHDDVEILVSNARMNMSLNIKT